MTPSCEQLKVDLFRLTARLATEGRAMIVRLQLLERAGHFGMTLALDQTQDLQAVLDDFDAWLRDSAEALSEPKPSTMPVAEAGYPELHLERA